MIYYRTILQILEKNAKKNPQKVIFEDTHQAITYEQFVIKSQRVGQRIFDQVHMINRPIAVYADKSVDCLIMMFGVLYSGNFYCVLDTKSPVERIAQIWKTLCPIGVITDMEDKVASSFGKVPIFAYSELFCEGELKSKDNYFCNQIIDSDPIYVLFTSGSTGVPKGTIISYKSVIAYASSVIQAFQITEDCIFGNQTPFYFSMSVLDIFVTILADATLYIIPKTMFSFPKKLLELLNEKRINTIYWVPTAMNIMVRFHAFDSIRPEYLKLVMFAGETMPVKCISYWQEKLPDICYANLFGPTEITDTCTYHILERRYGTEESVPIGIPFCNCNVFVINEKNELVDVDDTETDGELYVRGSFVGCGYYNAPELTKKAFVQNPLQSAYPEYVYKTGDRVKYNEKGELLYLGRMDNQIKHMGYRIELGEIEKACYAIDRVDTCACIYQYTASQIVLFVQTKLTEDQIHKELEKKLPKYMLPQQIIKLMALPINANGKIDKKQLRKGLENKK